jgi:hypothetical protein
VLPPNGAPAAHVRAEYEQAVHNGSKRQPPSTPAPATGAASLGSEPAVHPRQHRAGDRCRGDETSVTEPAHQQLVVAAPPVGHQLHPDHPANNAAAASTSTVTTTPSRSLMITRR